MRLSKQQLTIVGVSTLVMLIVLTGCAAKKGEKAADLVLKNGVIQTMVSKDDTAQAVAIKGDEIIYVGDDVGVEKFIGTSTQVTDLKGQMMTPGFMDGHIHVPSNWKTRLYGINLEAYFTEEEYLTAISDYVKQHPKDKVYQGEPFWISSFPESGPSKAALDAISPDKPIIIYDIAHHSIWTNSAGLKAGNITKDTVAPEGSKIWKDANGEPTGYLTDSGATDLITSKLDMPLSTLTVKEQEKAMADFQKEANAYGITGLTNIVGALAGETNSVDTYTKMDKAGSLTLRLRIANTFYPGQDPLEAVKIVEKNKKTDSDMVQAGTVKLYADGVTESGTAYMTQAYTDAAAMGDHWKGEPTWKTGELDQMISTLDKKGIQVHVHAIGDAAVAQTLDAYALADKTNGTRDARHTLTHVCAILPEDIKRMASLGVVTAQQFLWMYADALYDLEADFVGSARALDFYPTKTEHEAGVVISGASDAPVTPYNVLDEIEVGVTRNDPYDDAANRFRHPEEGLSAYQMLEAYTKNVAYQNFQEKLVGTVEVGKKADLVVLNQNILKVDPKKISDTKVVYTLSNGKIVYDAAKAAKK